MRTATLLTSVLATLAAASPVTTEKAKDQNKFTITNFVFGCTTTCDYSFDVTNTYSQLPGHPSFTKPVHCSGSLSPDNNSFNPSSCGKISKTQQLAAYIDQKTNELRIQYQVNVPSKKKGEAGYVYWYEGEKVVGAATGYNPSPSTFKVPETKAYAIG